MMELTGSGESEGVTIRFSESEVNIRGTGKFWQLKSWNGWKVVKEERDLDLTPTLKIIQI